MSDVDLVCRKINDEKPKLVFLNGKTSTGKTTLSNALRKKYNCAVIELDEVIYKLDGPKEGNRFLEAYQRRDDIEYVNSFVEAVKQEITTALENHDFVIIEGAIVQVETLHEIIQSWRNSFLFIYLDIKSITVYTKRLTERFVHSTEDDRNGLPHLFWNKFDPEILKQYYTNRKITPEIESAIEDYATDSMKESENRLTRFANEFDNIVKVEV